VTRRCWRMESSENLRARPAPRSECHMKRVLIIQAHLKQYRVPLFEKLRQALTQAGIDLCVAYSDPRLHEDAKNDNVELPSEYGVKVRGHWLFGDRILCQGVAGEIARSGLVLLEQAAGNAMNVPLLF